MTYRFATMQDVKPHLNCLDIDIPERDALARKLWEEAPHWVAGEARYSTAEWERAIELATRDH